VPIFSKVKINNKNIEFTPEQKIQINEDIKTWFVRFNRLNIPRTTGWTTGVGVSKLIHALTQEEITNTIGSTVLDGEYDVKGISIGVPIAVNQHGIKDIKEWNLLKDEREAFQKSVEKLRTIIQHNSSLF